MANNTNSFVNRVLLGMMNLLTHLLNTAETDKIKCNTAFSIFELINSNVYDNYSFSIVTLNCQSLHAKYDYVKVLFDNFISNNNTDL